MWDCCKDKETCTCSGNCTCKKENKNCGCNGDATHPTCTCGENCTCKKEECCSSESTCCSDDGSCGCAGKDDSPLDLNVEQIKRINEILGDIDDEDLETGNYELDEKQAAELNNILFGK